MQKKKMKQMKYFVLTFLTFVLCACSHDEGFTEPKSEAALSGLTLATTNGTYYQIKYSQREDVEVYTTNADADAIQAVRLGLADVYVGDEVILSVEDLQRLGLKVAFRGEECFDVAYAIKKGNKELSTQLNDFLASTPVEGIVGHWVYGLPAVDEPSYTIDPEAEPLRCVTFVNMSPISFMAKGGDWNGFDAEILRRFAHSLGRPFEMKFQDVPSAVIAIQTGQADVFAGCLFITEERQKSMDFTNPYYKCHPAYYVADGSTSERMTHRERLHMNLFAENRWLLILEGLGVTVIITFFSIVLGTVLGAGVCACRRSRRRWLRRSADLYSDFINGIPMLVLLLIMFYVVFASTGINAVIVAIITFALSFASTSGNIFDTAISSVPAGQTEAGLSLGFTPVQTFCGIVFPQALQKGLPLYIGECVSLLKNTSIVGYIAIQDLTRASDLIRSRTFDALVPLLIVTVLYFVLAWLIRVILQLLAKASLNRKS